jgi:L-ascorbate metabolism protein UlaG (beta-lactamase superfamily)
MKKALLWLKRAGIGLAAAVIVIIPASMWLWQDRPSVDQIKLQAPEVIETGAAGVRVTWLGVTTLLFDDGVTQILLDGFFSRPDIFDVLFRRPIESNAANINYALDEFRIRRLAAVIPVHSHYEHAMDVGAIANRSSASIVGTESTANIARGAGVPEEQIILATNGDTLQFGDFTATLITTRHVPNGFGDGHHLAGFMSEPVKQPAPVSEWREGGSWSILISHPLGNTLVQGSAGFIEDGLSDIQADVVMMSIGGLTSQGRKYTSDYWHQIVEKTGARRVYIMHFDDLTQPFGHIELFPTSIDNVVETIRWLSVLAKSGDETVEILRPIFGEPAILY